MSELKTKLNDSSVVDFLNAVEKDQKRKEAFEILEIMKAITKEEPKMWGDSIIGFGTYHYVYASGKEGDWMKIAFSPRKQNLVLYLMTGASKEEEILSRIGKFKTGSSCFYINKLADINIDVLKELIQTSWDKMNEKYPVRT